jgi:hypothetical protein
LSSRYVLIGTGKFNPDETVFLAVTAGVIYITASEALFHEEPEAGNRHIGD